MHTLDVKLPAVADIDEAFVWYEEQSPGLGIDSSLPFVSACVKYRTTLTPGR